MDEGSGGIRLKSSRDESRVYERTAKHYMPYEDGSTVQSLGTSDQVIRASVMVQADTIANARTAAAAELDDLIPAAVGDGERFELEGWRVQDDLNSNRVEISASYLYTQPALTGGVYGSS